MLDTSRVQISSGLLASNEISTVTDPPLAKAYRWAFLTALDASFAEGVAARHKSRRLHLYF